MIVFETTTYVRVGREFAIENLLFISEYMMFKNQFENEIVDAMGNDSCGFVVSLPNSVFPEVLKDSINEDGAIERLGINFYQKYIVSGQAPHELNISWTQRKALQDLFEEPGRRFSATGFANADDLYEKRQKILELFDGCGTEISRLLTDSYVRFLARRN